MAIFLGGAILWNVFLRAAQDASVSFLDDVWARSIVTLFASPLRLVEYGASLMAVGVIKVILGLSVMGVAAWLLYAFNMLSFGPWLLPFAANLVLFGYTLGLLALAHDRALRRALADPRVEPAVDRHAGVVGLLARVGAAAVGLGRSRRRAR